jgi:hypothetical protein
MAKQDHEYGVGERTDGTIDVFPESELQARLAEWRAQQEGETDEDDLADLDEVEALFDPSPSEETPEAVAADAFNEADHPRGQPENAGEFASSPGGGSKKKTEGGGKPDIRKNMVAERGDSTQPVKSLDELYDRAKTEEPAFRKMVEDIAEISGSKPKFGEKNGSILKTRESAERKLKDELGGDFTKIRDVLRGTVVGDSVEKTRDAAATFIAKQGDNVLRVKDRIVDKGPSGYRDILVNFRTPGGLVAELQFNSKAMVAAKEDAGYALYDSVRTGKLAGKSLDELQAAARAIYEKAYLDDGDGHWEMQA